MGLEGCGDRRLWSYWVVELLGCEGAVSADLQSDEI